MANSCARFNLEIAYKKTGKIRLTIKTVFHLIYSLLSDCVSLYGMHMCFNITVEQAIKEPLGNLKFYTPCYGTIWNYAFQTLFLFLALTHDALEWADKSHTTLCTKIRYWRDVIFSSLVVPYTCFVFGMFWSLFIIDRELVFPEVYDEVVPWWFNQCVHTNILAMVVGETLLQPRQRPTDRKLELCFNAAIGILYAIVYYSVFLFAGRWLYNVFGIMTWWQVCIFQCGIWLSSYIFYELQFPINRLIHGEDDVEERKEKNLENKTVANGENKEYPANSLKFRSMKQFHNSKL